MDEKIGKYEFVAEPFHVDFRGRLSLGILGNHLLNCASFHAKDRGFGIATLNEQHYTWVLSRLVIEMDSYPMDYKKFSIETWVENVYSLFTDRNYRIAGENGETLCILHYRDYSDEHISGDPLNNPDRHAHVLEVQFENGEPVFRL